MSDYNNEQDRQILALLGVTQTNYASIAVPVADIVGQPIGNGGCKAVILTFNLLARNGTSVVANTYSNYINPLNIPYAIYYGDFNRQEHELLAGFNSPIIFCRDLSEVFVRQSQNMAAAVTAKGLAAIELQIQLYS